MKPHPRIRKTIKWGGAAVTLLLVVVWLASPWWTFVLARGNFGATLDRGTVNFVDQSAAFAPEHRLPNMFRAGWRPKGAGEWRWWFFWNPSGAFVFVPVWTLAAAFVLPTAVAWWLDVRARRRERDGKCPKCHYDRAGIAAGAKCPECGNMPRNP